MGAFGTVVYLTQTRQIGCWYADHSRFIYSYNSWFVRGGYHNYGLDAGIFAFENEFGRANTNISFRLTLTPTGGTS